MSQPHMALAGMGGPVGGGVAVAQPMNAGTPGGSASNFSSPDQVAKKLNTAIYEYFLCNEKYDIARMMFKSDLPIETSDHIKHSPGQRGHANGVDANNNIDLDNKVHHGILNKPSDLPTPFPINSDDSSFLQDWWFQFWELHQGNRAKGPRNTLFYIGQQRQAQKTRQAMMNAANGDMQNGRGYGNGMNNGMNLHQAQLKNKLGPHNMAQQMRNNMANPNQPGAMQASQMERQNSQMDMSGGGGGGPRSGGSPNSGDAPSPKRQRTEGNMPMNQQGRPGQPGQMQANQVMPPNNAMGPAGAQSSPMSQPGMEAPSSEYYNAANNARMAAAAAAQAQHNGNSSALVQTGQGSNGNHALQDYQMQLMLLEQQNKKRLLMARQEQDSMAHPAGVPGQIQGRGSPTPAMMDPNMTPGLQRQMLMANGQPLMRPPSSHPGMNPMTAQQQAEMLRQNGQMMPNGGNWQGGPQPPQGMMQGQPGQQPGQPPNMTPRAGNMPPPPAPPVAKANTQPSSPAQPPAPPTPSGNAKVKAGLKKETKASKAAAKKGAPAAANEDNNQPPTPTPPPPVTPSAVNSFNNHNKNLPGANGAPGGPQGNNPNNQPPTGAVQPQQPDMSMAPFGSLDGGDPMDMSFAGFENPNVLDTFDFDTFLNDSNDGLEGFDANFAFGDGSLETDGVGN